jgi:hypothetical protein
VITADGSTGTTAVAGNGYFIDTTSAAHTLTLPASATIGDFIAIKDYAGTFATNNLTIARNGHNIQGAANDSLIQTNRASLVLVYVDSTKGWLYWEEHNVADLQAATFITATGGTVTTSGDFKIHSFTGDGCFVVSSTANPVGGPNSVDYLVVAGGGGGGDSAGGAGGYRESHSTPVSGCYTASPLATPTGITVSATTYPVTVGGGGAGTTNSPFTPPVSGSNSVFSTITSAGGGTAACGAPPGPNCGGSGGGGRGGYGGTSTPNYGCAGSGNTPPVSPPQGNPGGPGSGPALGGGPGNYMAGGGGGAGGAGNAWNSPNPGCGGVGTGTGINPSPSVGDTGPNGTLRYFSGGGGASQESTTPATQPASIGGYGGGGDRPHSPGPGDGDANTGGGGASNRFNSSICAGAGGKGIVIIRYKYQ